MSHCKSQWPTKGKGDVKKKENQSIKKRSGRERERNGSILRDD
jgi:hypothetical protein